MRRSPPCRWRRGRVLEVEGVEVWEEYSEHQREDILEKVKLFWEETLCETIFLPDDRRLKFSARSFALFIQYQRMHFISQNPAILIKIPLFWYHFWRNKCTKLSGLMILLTVPNTVNIPNPHFYPANSTCDSRWLFQSMHCIFLGITKLWKGD